MKIAFFADNFYPELSGISDSIVTISKELAKRGHSIQIYAPFYSKKEYDIANIPQEEINLGNNIAIIRLFSFPYKASPTRQSRIAIPSLKVLFRLYRFKPDIIHVHSPFGTGLSGIFAAKMLSIPLVGTNHTIVSEFAYFFPFFQNFFAKLSSHYDAWFYNQCSFVSAPSRIVFHEMKKYGFKKNNMVVSNPIASIFFSSGMQKKQKTQLKKKFSLSPHTLVFAGALAVHKKIDLLFHSLSFVRKTFPDITLALAGDGADFSKLQKLAHSLGIQKNVLFLGKLPQKELSELFLASEIFVLASTAETQNMALLQAEASSLAAICVNARALPEYIFNGENGYIVPVDNPQSFSDAIISLIHNEKLRELMGQKGHQYAQSFSVNHISSQWIKIYQKIIKEA